MPNIHSIAIASDHAGYSLKEMLCDYLKENDYEIENLGADSADSTDY
ncbi:MAG TPA: ribose-5-phosphate isomerase, partial [Verrucomicrobiales bacterium]|nr:ribose-5-phosphate isomerase [Verrucomicrobiales bacterium]